MRMKGLTQKQHEILDFIQKYIETHHYSPSYREIMHHFSFASTGSVYKYVKTLIQKGVLAADKQSHRSMCPIGGKLPEKEWKADLEVDLPLIGNFTAGYPLELFMKPQNISVPTSMVHSNENTYVLQVRGDSLREEGICDGDLVLIETRSNIEPGETILGIINQHDTILKRYFPEGQHIRLESQHPHLPVLTVRFDHILIQGVLVGLLRFY